MKWFSFLFKRKNQLTENDTTDVDPWTHVDTHCTVSSLICVPRSGKPTNMTPTKQNKKWFSFQRKKKAIHEEITPVRVDATNTTHTVLPHHLILRDLFPDFEKDNGLLQFVFDMYDNMVVLLETDIDECRALVSHYKWCMSHDYEQKNDAIKLHLRHGNRKGMESSLRQYAECEERLLVMLNDPGAIIEHFLSIVWQFHDAQFKVAMQSVKRHVKNLKNSEPSMVSFVHRFQEIMNVDRTHNFALMKQLSTDAEYKMYLTKHAIESRISVGKAQADTLLMLGNCYRTSPKNIETTPERARYLYHMFLFAKKKGMHDVWDHQMPAFSTIAEPNTNTSVFADRCAAQIPLFAPLISIEYVELHPTEKMQGYVATC